MRSFEATWQDGALCLRGDLDLAREQDLLDSFAAGWDGQPELVVDLSELRFIDSTGIRALLRLAQRTDRGVVLRAPKDNVRRALEIVRVAEWDRVTISEGHGPAEG